MSWLAIVGLFDASWNSNSILLYWFSQWSLIFVLKIYFVYFLLIHLWIELLIFLLKIVLLNFSVFMRQCIAITRSCMACKLLQIELNK